MQGNGYAQAQGRRGREAGKGFAGIVSRKLEGKMINLVCFERNFLKMIEDLASTFFICS
jgi:hypothetical protein